MDDRPTLWSIGPAEAWWWCTNPASMLIRARASKGWRRHIRRRKAAGDRDAYKDQRRVAADLKPVIASAIVRFR